MHGTDFFDWNSNDVRDTVRQLLAQGASTGYIACELSRKYNRPISRSAVGGYLWRNSELKSYRPTRPRSHLGDVRRAKRAPVMMRRPVMEFTEAMDAVIRSAFKIGYGGNPSFVASLINGQFGTALDRAAVTTRMQQLGLFRDDLRAKAEVRKPATVLAGNVGSTIFNAPAVIPNAVVHDEPQTFQLEPEVHGVSLIASSSAQCKWPVHGEAEHMHVCGEPALSGRPYCARHAMRAYRPIHSRKPTTVPSQLPRRRR